MHIGHIGNYSNLFKWLRFVERVIGLSVSLFGCALTVSPSDSRDAAAFQEGRRVPDDIDAAAAEEPSPPSSCGNGVIESNEACDDGNRESGDFCSADCRSVDLCPGGVLPGDFRFPNRYRWDPSYLTKCTVVKGSVILEDENLEAFEGPCNIERIEGDLRVGRIYDRTFDSLSPSPAAVEIALMSIKGFDSLKSVGGDIIIYNTGLGDLEGLENLTEVGGDLQILDNGSLNSLAGMTHLTRIGGSLVVKGNAFLSGDLNGPQKLIEIEGDLVIRYNEIVGDPMQAWAAGSDVLIERHLANLRGLENLKSIGGSLYVREPQLPDLHNLYRLESVGGSVVVGSTGPEDLSNLETIGKHILFYFTDVTDILLELTGLNFIGGDLYIVGNRSLGTCKAIDFSNRLVAEGFSGTVSICGTMEDECGSESCTADPFDILASIIPSEGYL